MGSAHRRGRFLPACPELKQADVYPPARRCQRRTTSAGAQVFLRACATTSSDPLAANP
jgi:hypothetical protein